MFTLLVQSKKSLNVSIILLKVPVVVPSQESELSCIYVLGVSILLFDF